LKAQCNKLLSTFAFKFNLRRFTAAPFGVTIDPEGYLIVTDPTSHRLRKMGPAARPWREIRADQLW
jgi:hypothetical protein